MSFLLIVTTLMFCVLKVEMFCIFNLSSDEQACATPLKLNSSSVLEFYNTNSENPLFAEYLKCIWLKWNFITQDGVILYENIEQSTSLPWYISRICEDVASLITQAQLDFKKSAIYCKQHPPAVATTRASLTITASNRTTTAW